MNYRKSFFIFFISLISLQGFAGCDENNRQIPDPMDNSKESENDSTATQLKITVGSNIFLATLSDSETADAFIELLPLTINMSELNGNEKLFRFDNNLPTNASIPASIQEGDLMLYGSRTLVLFYKSFPTSYSYTRLGRVNDTSGLAAALGSGNIEVTFEID